jgi:hypothetical protein
MKSIFALLIIFFLLSFNIYDAAIIVHAKMIRSYDSIYPDKSKHKMFDVNLSVLNKSTKPIAYWIMTCDWQDNFIINNDYIHLVYGICDSNCPWIFHINPGDSLVYKASVERGQESKYRQVEATKFGFIYIDTIRCKNISDYQHIIGDKSKQDKIIWSNPLYLRYK